MSMLVRFVKDSNGLEEVNRISNSLNRYRKYIFSVDSYFILFGKVLDKYTHGLKMAFDF